LREAIFEKDIMLKKDKEKCIRKLWREKRPNNPSDDDMFGFFCSLRKEHYELTVWDKQRRDPWQTIHCWLIDEERKLTKVKKPSKKPQQPKP
jgi:hypothetical protein